MSLGTVNAYNPEKSQSKEREDLKLILYIGVFFDDSHSKGKGAKLSSLYKNGYKKESERAYSITKTIAVPDSIYVWKDNNLIIQDSGRNELFYKTADVVEDVIKTILNLISGYSEYDDIEINIDIYGLDKGLVSAYTLAHIIEPENDGFNSEDRTIILGSIDSSFIELFQSLKHKKRVNHLEILETIYAQNDVQYNSTKPKIDDKLNDGYAFSLSVEKNNVFQKESEPIKHGFTKSEINEALDNLQASLDAAGMVDLYGIGSIADALNVIVSLGRGQWANAGLSLLAIIPIIGNYATAAKTAKRIKTNSKIIKGTDTTKHLSKGGGEITDDVVVDFKKYKEAKNIEQKVIPLEQRSVKTGTGTVYNSIDGVGGTGGYYGGSYSSYGSSSNRVRTSPKKETSIFDNLDDAEDQLIRPVEKIDGVDELNPIGIEQQGQEHALNIINLFKWKGK